MPHPLIPRGDQHALRSLCHLPAHCGQQATHDPFPHLVQSVSEQLHVSILLPRRGYADGRRWNEWIVFPIRYCDLPLSAQVTFTVWDIAGPRAAVPVGGSTFRLFGKKWCVHSGLCVHCAHLRLHALVFCAALRVAGRSAGVSTAFCYGLGSRRTARSKPLRRASSSPRMRWAASRR